MLPGENVCTENLTPWKKLLPCGAKRGLSTFLNADHIHSTKYHNLGLSLRKVCPGHTNQCSDPEIELSLFVVLVRISKNMFFIEILLKLHSRASRNLMKLEVPWKSLSQYGSRTP